MNAGEPLFESSPRDTYCRDVRELVQNLTGQPVASPTANGLLGRLFKYARRRARSLLSTANGLLGRLFK